MSNNKAKQSNKKVLAAVVAVLIVAIAMFGIYKVCMPKGQVGAKEIHVTVVHGDQSTKEFDYQTDAAYLGEVVVDEGLAEGDTTEFGLYIKTVDGETADESKEQWWCLSKGGEALETGADQAPIEDGDQFEFTLIEGY